MWEVHVQGSLFLNSLCQVLARWRHRQSQPPAAGGSPNTGALSDLTPKGHRKAGGAQVAADGTGGQSAMGAQEA